MAVRANLDLLNLKDAFVAKLNVLGVLTWNAFLGGSRNDKEKAIAIDANGVAYVAGTGGNWGTPVRPYTDSWDVFVAKVAVPCGAQATGNWNNSANWDCDCNPRSW